VLALTEAVAKLGRWRPPMRLNDITRAYFERMAVISPPDRAARFNGLSDASQAASVLEYFAQNDPGHYAMLVTTITPTILRGGYQSNVIPSEAEATLDIRALPDEDMEKFYAEMRRLINNPRIEIVPRTAGLRPITKPSRLDTELFRALESVQKRLNPDLRTIPTMQTGATDMSYLREKGVQCYGIGPVYDVEDAAKGFGAHSDQERISEEGLYDFLRYAWGVVNEVAVKR
jgi:acetylornithine deacetylase/succinyl-diaminopimelate desuccinylase-like protein